jgi:hypothetical protein
MLLHHRVNYSTFPAQSHLQSCLSACNRWLQCRHMRIELPSTPWPDTVQRAEDDAHTLTVAAAQPALDWFAGAWSADCGLTQRVEVAAGEPLTLTVTFRP